MTYKGKTIVLTPEQALASVAGRLVSLPAPPSRSGRRWLVPVEFISRALTLVYDARLDLRKPSHLLVVGDLRVPRILVRYDSLGAGGRLTIDATPRANSTVTQEGERILVKFDADALDAPSPLLPPQTLQAAAPFVRDVRVADTTTIAIDLGPRFAGFKAAVQPVGRHGAAGHRPRRRPDRHRRQRRRSRPRRRRRRTCRRRSTPPASAIRTIAIDPGHGGEDEGVQGAQGDEGKGSGAGRRAPRQGRDRGASRHPRPADARRRPERADRRSHGAREQQQGGSLHQPARQRVGPADPPPAPSIFLAAFDDERQRSRQAGARRAGPDVRRRSRATSSWCPGIWRRRATSTQSVDVRDACSSSSCAIACRWRSHPIDRAPLRVLESANMPAVLLEMGFLTNPEQEKQLAGDVFQNARGAVDLDAVVRFRDSLNAGGGR